MAKFEVNALIRKPVEVVYQAYINPVNMPKWIKDLEKIETIEGKAGEDSATVNLHYEKRGLKKILKYHIEYREPGKYIKKEFTGDRLDEHLEIMFDRVYDETELTILWNGKGKTPKASLLLAFNKNKIKKQMQSELDYFKELVEKHGKVFK